MDPPELVTTSLSAPPSANRSEPLLPLFLSGQRGQLLPNRERLQKRRFRTRQVTHADENAALALESVCDAQWSNHF